MRPSRASCGKTAGRTSAPYARRSMNCSRRTRRSSNPAPRASAAWSQNTADSEKTNDIVKINTSAASKGPSKEWINIAYTQSAKSKIKAFFSKIDKEETIKNGKESLLKTLRRKKISINDFFTVENIKLILDDLGINEENDLYYDIGIGRANPTQVIKIVNGKDEEEDVLKKVLKYSSKGMDATGEIIIDGMDDLKVSFGGCCFPVKGDQIVGYISKGNGITIHRKSCHNICDVTDRIINAKWNEKSNKKYITNILVYTDKNEGVLLEIITKTSSLNIGIKSINTINNIDYNLYDINILIEDIEKLNKYMSIISQIPHVNSVERGCK